VVITIKVPKDLSAPASAEFLEGEVYIPDWLLSGYKSRNPGSSDIDDLANLLFQKVMRTLGVENYLQFKEGYKTHFGCALSLSISIPAPFPVLSDLPAPNISISIYTGRVTSPDTTVMPLQAKYDKLVAEHDSLLKLVKFNPIYHEP
jgi:hypothetical protein